MFHAQGFWLRTLRLNPLKPFALRPGCLGERVGLRGQGERPRSWSHSGGPGERVGLMQEDPQLDHAVRSLSNVSHSSLLASHTAAQST